jgi:rhodanese-related sulfurtransferase
MKLFSPKEAEAYLKAQPQAAFLDIRSFVEFYFVGHPVGAMNVPWTTEDWDLNPRFVEEVQALGIKPQQPIVLICRSGKRTLEAGAALEAAGYTDIAHVTTGFEGDLNTAQQRSLKNGWRFDGLPWEQG